MYSSTGFSRRRTLFRAGGKVVAVAMTGAMVSLMVPASALAHYSPNNTSGKALLVDQSTDSWGNELKKTENADGSVSYTGIAHGDINHYNSYGLTTTITTDSDGKVTAIDISSGNETFAGAWSYKVAHGYGDAIEGYLPDDVEFVSTKNEDGTYTIGLTGGEAYGTARIYAGSSGRDASAPPNQCVFGYSVSDGKITEVENGVSYDSGTGVVTINDDSVSLVKAVCQFGAESIFYNAYFAVGDEASQAAANAYIDSIEPTGYETNPDLTVEEGSRNNPKSIANTNRNTWGKTMMSMYGQRILQSWGAYLADDSLTTEMDDLDTISGATKTSEPFVNSLNQAVLDGYVKGIAENVKLTIDGEETDVNDDPVDKSTVSVNSAGQYVLNNAYSGAVNSIEVYQTGTKLTTKEVQDMAKNRSSYTATTYTAESLKLNPTTSTQTDRDTGKTTEITSYSWGDFKTDLVDVDFADGNSSRSITALDSSVNAIALTYTIGHANITIAYDLEQMKAAGDVKAQIESLGNEPADVIAARAAYEALNTDVRGFVTNIDKLQAAESGLTLSKASVTLSQKSYTYDGKKKQPKVTVKLSNTTLREGSDYTLKYSNNTNAGTATVTVTGKGSYSGSAKATFTITKASQSLKVSTAQKSVKASKVKKSKQTTSKVSVSGAKTAVTYAKSSGSKKLSIDKKTGKITVAKGTGKGTYSIKVKVTAAANGNYKAASKTVTVKVKVK